MHSFAFLSELCVKKSAREQGAAAAQHMQQPVKAELEQLAVVLLDPAAAVAVKAESGQQIVLADVVAECVNVVADHEGELLERPAVAFALPRIAGEKHVHLRPEVVEQVAFGQPLPALPLFDGLEMLLEMPFAVRVPSEKPAAAQTAVRQLFHCAFKRIGAAGRRPVCVHRTALLDEKGAGVIAVSPHVEKDRWKERMRPCAKPGVPLEKFRRTKREAFFQPENIIGEKPQFNVAAAGQKAAHSGMAAETEWLRVQLRPS